MTSTRFTSFLSVRAGDLAAAALVLILAACDAPAPPPAAPGAGGAPVAPSTSGAAATAASGGTGRIAGKVVLAGVEIPARKKIDVNVDVAHCGAQLSEESLIVDAAGRGIANVVVIIEGIPAAAPAAAPAPVTIANKGCAFVPHVALAPVGGELLVTNEDPVLHTTHAYETGRNFFNVSISPGGAPIRRPLRRAGVIEVQCDVHKWMRAWVYVHGSAHAALTGADGSFTLSGVPAGAHTVKAWHETLGELTGSVTVRPNEDAPLEFTFAAK